MAGGGCGGTCFYLLSPFLLSNLSILSPLSSSLLLSSLLCPRKLSSKRQRFFPTTGRKKGGVSSRLTLLFSTYSTAAATAMVPQSFRGVFVGSGSDGMSDPRMTDTILDMVTASSSVDDDGDIIKVLYIGTATYDLPQFAQRQTRCFVDRGCCVESLNLVDHSSTATFSRKTEDVDHSVKEEEEQLIRKASNQIASANVIVVGGGNTLYAMDTWKRWGIDTMLRQAMDRGTVLTGGSAGAICWFDGGHSDSCDPGSFYNAMMKKYGSTFNNDGNDGITGVYPESLPPLDESDVHPEDADDESRKHWKYIRVPGLGFLPGLCCPHHDRIQSNGVLRADDFDAMLVQKHSGELGIGIDHWAALVVNGADESYRVVSLEGKKGSVLYKDDKKKEDEATLSPQADGVPGIWIKHVEDGKVVRRLLSPTGKLSSVLRKATTIVNDDEVLEECRRMNPNH